MVQKKKYNRRVFHVYVYVILIDFCGLKFNVSFIFIKSYKKGQSCSNILKKKIKVQNIWYKKKKNPEKKQTQNNPPPKKPHQNNHNYFFQLVIFIACFSL